MTGKRRVWATLSLIVLLTLTSTGLVSAQAPGVFIPYIGDNGVAERNSVAIGAQWNKGPTNNVYIVVMSADPVVAYAGGIAGIAATAPTGGTKIDATSEAVQSYVAFLEASHATVMDAVGVSAEAKLYSYAFALNGFAAKLTPEQAAAMAAQPGVAMVVRDQFRFRQQADTTSDGAVPDDAVPNFLGLNDPDGAWARNYTGEDVIVGVIDSGIWPEHPSFADNGSYDQIVPPGSIACEFGDTAWNPADLPFTCNNKLIGAHMFLEAYIDAGVLTPDEFRSARDDNGHGTHTASTAAGNANVPASIFGIPRGRVSGVAPRARIIAYKGLGDLGGFTSDLTAAINQAVADGVDVINYSVGGGASLTTPDEIAYLFAADAGVFVATSAGNSGPGDATIGGPANVPWITTVGASFPDRLFISEVRVSGPGREPKDLWGGSITPGIANYNLVDAEGIADVEGVTTGECLNPFPAGTFQANDAVLCNRYDFGAARTTRVQNVKDGGGGAVLFYNVPTVNVTPTDNHPLPTVHMLHRVGIRLKNYLNEVSGPVSISFTEGRARYAGDDRRVTPNVMTSFSSRGPNPVALDIIKPDVTAPGYQILAGASPDHVGTAAQGELFQAIMGTSMSSPHVAGLFALIKQAHPDWTPAMAKSALMTTAHQRVYESDMWHRADPFDMGAGHVDATLRSERGSMFQPGLVYDAGFTEYLGFMCGAAPEIFANPTATCNALTAAGIPTDPSDLNLPSIGVADLTGTQVVTRKFTSVAADDELRTYKVNVNAPRGYKITVEPSTIRLRSGETATYQLTITNRHAPIGEWRFGSLTWTDRERGRDFEVYSPIALRASLFDGPAEISGTGESGSASFDVKFGYTGDYAAAAHGLVPATVTADNVPQDPDQNFDPDDGFSDVYNIAVSGVAHMRFAIPPEATETDADLDLYLVNPSGELVAASFNAGTDEVINVTLPEDGTWQLYVHGWAAPGGDSDYELFQWLVSATPGGNLSISSAPTSATSGETAEITVGWTGATAGQWHLGAVSHNSDGALLGLTLVEVDNR